MNVSLLLVAALTAQAAAAEDAVSRHMRAGKVAYDAGDCGKAETEYAAAAQAAADAGQLDRVSAAMSNLGSVRDALGRRGQAVADYLKSVEAGEAARPPAKNLRNIYFNLARAASDDEQAMIFLNRSIELMRAARDARGEGKARMHVALRLRHLGRDVDAEAVLKKAAAIHSAGSYHNELADVYSNLGYLYEARGDLGKGVEHHRRAVAEDEKAGGLDRPAARDSLSAYAAALRKAGRTDEAASYEARVARIDARPAPPSGAACQASTIRTQY